MYVVEHYRHAVTGSLGQADVPRYNSFKYLRAEEATEVGGNLLRERSAVVIHGEKDAFDREGWVDRPTEAHQSVEKLSDTFQCQELALDRDEDGIRGGQRVEREQVERRCAVNEDVVVLCENTRNDGF